MKQLFIIIFCMLILSGCRNEEVTRSLGSKKVNRVKKSIPKENLYVVKSGDTLGAIARRYKSTDTLEQIIKRNKIKNPNKLSIGQELNIIMGTKTVPKKKPEKVPEIIPEKPQEPIPVTSVSAPAVNPLTGYTADDLHQVVLGTVRAPSNPNNRYLEIETYSVITDSREMEKLLGLASTCSENEYDFVSLCGYLVNIFFFDKASMSVIGCVGIHANGDTVTFLTDMNYGRPKSFYSSSRTLSLYTFDLMEKYCPEKLVEYMDKLKAGRGPSVELLMRFPFERLVTKNEPAEQQPVPVSETVHVPPSIPDKQQKLQKVTGIIQNSDGSYWANVVVKENGTELTQRVEIVDSNLPAILASPFVPVGHLETKDKIVTIKNGHDGTLYTVQSSEGEILAVDISANEVSNQFPDLTNIVEHGIAEWAGMDEPAVELEFD